jgi:hypothetical protein
MTRPRWAALALALLALGANPRAAAALPGQPVARFAIVIGNNRPEDATRPVLRYADDDAVATHRLFVEAGVDSLLLARLDDQSRRLHAGLVPFGAPRWAELTAALDQPVRQGRHGVRRKRAGRRELA